MTDLVPTDHAAAIEALDPQAREIAVTRMLSEARSWLAHAVEASEPAEIATFKAQMATINEWTKQLGLSKEIQLDAQEMVRRAERGVGLAIRKGQDEGTVIRRGGNVHRGFGGELANSEFTEARPVTDFASKDDLIANGAGIYHLTDGVSDEQFDEAVTEAKCEGNLSRANVVRKIRGQDGVATRQQRADLIASLAEQGYSSRQMPSRVGVSEETIRLIARDFSIEIPADKIMGRTRRANHTEMVEKTVTDLENNAEFIHQFIDLDQVDLTNAGEWVASLVKSARAIKTFVGEINKRVARTSDTGHPDCSERSNHV